MTVLRVLLIEDGAGDAGLIREALSLSAKGSFELDWVQRLGEGLAKLHGGDYDAVLLDLSLPDSRGVDTVTKFRAECPDVPTVVLTGLDDEHAAVAALKRGAQDYLVKGTVEPDNLARAIRYAIARRATDRNREDYLHNVNHELRSPLAAVFGALTMLRDEVPLTEPGQVKFLNMALRGVEHLLDMTDDLAEVVRAESGKLTVRCVPVPLTELVSVTTRLMALSHKARDLSLSVEADSGAGSCLADPVRLRQVLMNLLANAIKFTPKGGRVVVRVAPDPSDPAFVRVSVEDNGCGIAPDAAGRLFKRLYQVPEGSPQTHGGLGIGLYLCREIVAAHGGRIWVDPAEGKGSVFSFTLPVHGPAA